MRDFEDMLLEGARDRQGDPFYEALLEQSACDSWDEVEFLFG